LAGTIDIFGVPTSGAFVGPDQGKLTKEVLTTTIKKWNTSGGKLKVTGKKEQVRERLEAVLQSGE
jgi:hypothetical protein